MLLRKFVSVVVPVFNEEKNIPILHDRLTQVMQKINYDFELIFVNDCSTDRTFEVMQRLAKKNKRLTIVDLARNFGKEAAMTAGLDHVRGDAALLLDADLQHPPEYIPAFLEKWEQGAEVVVGVRKNNHAESKIKQMASKWFYRIINKISDTEFVPNSTDFRLLDSEVVNAFNYLSERNRITRGLIDWLGFKRSFVYFNAASRHFGQPTYTFQKLIKLAMDSMTSMSFFPLKLAGYIGILIILLSGPLGIFIFFNTYIWNDPFNLNFSGPAILAVIILFLVGIILACMGLISLYIAHIHSEVSRRPLYVKRQWQRPN